MRVLLLILISYFSLTVNAQLKYRAKEDFGLKDKVKVMKVITQSIADGDTIFGIFDGVEEHHFSKTGFLRKTVRSNWLFLENFTTLYKYEDTLVLSYSSLDSTSKGVFIIQSDGNVKLEAQLERNTSLQTIEDKELIKKTLLLYTRYFYNKNGLLKELISYEPDRANKKAHFHSQDIYKYNNQKLVIEKNMIFNDSLGNRTINYKYNKKGKLTKKEVAFNVQSHKTSNSSVSHYSYTNTSLENSVRIIRISQYEYVAPSNIKTYFYYDNKKNVIKEENFKEVGGNEYIESIITYEIEYY